MSRPRQRTFFPAVTTTVLILAAFGLAASVLRQHIPDPPKNQLSSSTGDYLRAGAHQDIRWYALGQEAFAEAKRRDKPLFISLGANWSTPARQADKQSFLNLDVIERLRQGYVCVRVDVDQNPEWLAAYLPVSRALVSDVPRRQLWFEPSFQVMILDPSLQMYSWIVRRAPFERMEPNFFLGGFLSAKERLEGAERKLEDYPPPGAIQSNDAAVLVSRQAPARMFVAAHLNWLRGHIDPAFGGQPINGFQLLRPSEWRFFLQMDADEDLRRSMGPALRSAIVDWIDGGFYRIAGTPSWQAVEFDKLAVQNAEMMALLARCYRQNDDKLALEIASRTFDALTGPFMVDGLVMGYRTVGESANHRSLRASFSPKTLREHFDSTEREWLRENLGLKVEINPQMVPMLSKPEALLKNPQGFEAMLSKLRKIYAKAEVTYGSGRLLDVNAFVCARLLETARLLGDRSRMAVAAELFDRLGAFRVGVDDVIHGLDDDARAYRYLGDYVSYADAAFEHYRTFGLEGPLSDGLRVLKRALFLFEGAGPGIILNGTFSGLTPKPPRAVVPEIVDNVRESSLAMSARLSFSYGLALGDKELSKRARSIFDQNASAANQIQHLVSGLFCAAWLIERDQVIVVSGPERVALARELSALLPNELVLPAPSSGPLGKARPPGAYLVQKDAVSGPFSAGETVTRINALR